MEAENGHGFFFFFMHKRTKIEQRLFSRDNEFIYFVISI